MLACSGRRDSGPATAAAGWLSLLSLSKTCVASSSSSQSMFSFAPFGDVGGAGGATPGTEPVVLDAADAADAGPGRVLAGGGTWLGAFCVPLGDAAAMPDWLGEPDPGTAWRFGSDARPGGGGGLEGVGGADGVAARIDPDCGGDDGSGGGDDTRPEGGPAAGGAGGRASTEDDEPEDDGDAGGIAASPLWLGGCAGPGIPMSVFFMSPAGMATGICGAEADPGGGGGAADVRAELFLPRPSKMSRSEPLLLSSDIRVS